MTNTKLMLVTNVPVNVRTSPALPSDNSNLVASAQLKRDDVLKVRIESRRDNDGWIWWEHADHAGYWSASETSPTASFSAVLMEDFTPKAVTTAPKKPIQPDEQSTKIMRVINQNVNVRTSPALPSDNGNYVADVQLTENDVLRVRLDSRTDNDGWIWWEHADHAGYWSASETSPTSSYSAVLMEDFTPVSKTPVQPPEPKQPIPTQGKMAQPDASVESGKIPQPSTKPAQPDKKPDKPTQPATPSIGQWFEVKNSGGLTVRSEPKLGNNVIQDERLNAGMLIKFHNPTKGKTYEWWEQVDKPGHWSASHALSGRFSPLMVKVENNAEGGSHRVSVPWNSQIQFVKNLANDCGHACVLMVMQYLDTWMNGKGQTITIPMLYDLTQYRHQSGWTNTAQLKSIAKEYGVELESKYQHRPPKDVIDIIKQTLKNNGPVILLVQYEHLGITNPTSGGGRFAHWVVVTGYEGDIIFVNDPLWTSPTYGRNLAVKADNLSKAISATNDGYMIVFPG